MKTKSSYICSECGYRSPKWLGRCPGCGGWNLMTETVETVSRTSTAAAARVPVSAGKPSAPRKIGDIKTVSEARCFTGIGELDRVLGGGIVDGELVLVGGDPGIGKSTLLLQICAGVDAEKKVLYISGEESEGQIKMRAERLGVGGRNVYILSETDTDKIVTCIYDFNPNIVIIDSIQTMHCDKIASAAGSVPQVRETTSALMHIAKSNGIAMFIVGHVTKDGSLAGPRVLEHMVDCVLYFEGDRQLSFRILRAVKNRFGSTNEIGVFEMCDMGLREVSNPSAALLEGRETNTSGSAIVCTMEGSRGVLAEIQALVAPTGFGNPRRMSKGIDLNRLFLMTAVLEKRAHINLSNCDVYLNVAGGLRIDEPAADLGICAAIAAGRRDVAIPPDIIFVGEVGLGGEVRAVSQLEKRLNEASKLGFSRAIVPRGSLRGVKIPKDFNVTGIKTIGEAIKIIAASHI